MFGIGKKRKVFGLVWVLAVLLLSGCATTKISVHPSAQTPVCDSSASALVLWAPQWRENQKDVASREQAAEAGIAQFLQTTNCFSKDSQLQRIASLDDQNIQKVAASLSPPMTKIVTVGVHELGPVVKLLSSFALVEGGTEVVLDISEYDGYALHKKRVFTVRWANGGAGVVKGVATLPDDMKAALIAGLQPINSTQ